MIILFLCILALLVAKKSFKKYKESVVENMEIVEVNYNFPKMMAPVAKKNQIYIIFKDENGNERELRAYSNAVNLSQLKAGAIFAVRYVPSDLLVLEMKFIKIS